MYSLEERLLALKTYDKMGRNAKATVRRLGYPDETSIAHWVKEYERNHNLHGYRVRYGEIILQEWVPGFQVYGRFPPGKKIIEKH